MPPKNKKGGKAAKCRKDQHIETEGEIVEGPADDQGDEHDEEDSVNNDRIVQFFEERRYFYDIGDESWTNKKMKDAELKAFAEIISLSPDKILRKWKNWRTDYGKLRRSEGKSGQGAVKKTRLQQWKLQRLAFLAPYIVQRSGQGIEMGGGADDEATEQLHDGSSDEESVCTVPEGPEDSRNKGLNTSTSTKSYKKQKTQQPKKAGGEVSAILSQLLEENRKKDAELALKIDQSAEKRLERDTFADWLGSVVHQVPDQHFRSFQTEVFGLSLKYLQSVSADGPAPADHQSGYGSQFQSPCWPLQQPPLVPQSFIRQPYKRASAGSTSSIISHAYSTINQEDTTTTPNFIDRNVSYSRNPQISTDAGSQDAGDCTTASTPVIGLNIASVVRDSTSC